MEAGAAGRREAFVEGEDGADVVMTVADGVVDGATFGACAKPADHTFNIATAEDLACCGEHAGADIVQGAVCEGKFASAFGNRDHFFEFGFCEFSFHRMWLQF